MIVRQSIAMRGCLYDVLCVRAQDVCKGYNGTIFACAHARRRRCLGAHDARCCRRCRYGQTGTGKTYTMMGPEDPDRPAGAMSATAAAYDSAKRGIIPRALDEARAARACLAQRPPPPVRRRA